MESFFFCCAVFDIRLGRSRCRCRCNRLAKRDEVCESQCITTLQHTSHWQPHRKCKWSAFVCFCVVAMFSFAFCKCRLPQMTIIVQHSSWKYTHTHTLTRKKNKQIQNKTKHIEIMHRARATHRTKKSASVFFRPMIQMVRRFHLSHTRTHTHIAIHKSSVGSINKAFNKCNFFTGNRFKSHGFLVER